MKKLLPMLMAIVLVIGLVPVVAASAAGTDPHECNLDGYEYNGDGTHRVYCTICKGIQTESTPCVWESGACICGSTKPAEPSCNHTDGFTYQPNGTTMHDVICAKCGENTGTVPCVFTDGVCLACGNKSGTSQPACDHTGNHWEYIPVDKLNHSVKCADCGKIVTESTSCVFTDGKCVCGNVAGTSKPACDHTGNHWKYIPNGHLYHDVRCKDCNTLVNEKVPCVFTNGVCLACGNVAKTACDHVGVQDCIPLDATHHKVVCPKCGATVEECVDCVFESGVCACGNKKPVHGNTNDKNLDQVPKTGDVLAPVMILSGLMSAAGFVTKKRFF